LLSERFPLQDKKLMERLQVGREGRREGAREGGKARRLGPDDVGLHLQPCLAPFPPSLPPSFLPSLPPSLPPSLLPSFLLTLLPLFFSYVLTQEPITF
jgi:hypothetical protein